VLKIVHERTIRDVAYGVRRDAGETAVLVSGSGRCSGGGRRAVAAGRRQLVAAGRRQPVAAVLSRAVDELGLERRFESTKRPGTLLGAAKANR
jgi:hypothetical protein